MFPTIKVNYVATLLIIISNISCTSSNLKDNFDTDVRTIDSNISLNSNILIKEIISNGNNFYISQFKKAYDRMKVGKIIEANVAFEKLKNSKDKVAIELGEYGLLISTFETENLPKMLNQINNIKALDNKSEWLNDELIAYEALYYFTSSNFAKTKSILNDVSKTEISSNPILNSLNVALYIRNNELDNAWKAIKNSKFESELSISYQAYLISITKGNKEVISYLQSKLNQYPENEYIQLIYHSYLVNTDKSTADNLAYQLGMKSENPNIIIYSIDTLMVKLDRDNKVSMDRLTKLANKLNHLDSAKEYIDYYIFRIAIPSEFYNINRSLKIANSFNAKNYRLLLNEYYIYPQEQKLRILKTIESLDPYNHNTMILLAQLYRHEGMKQELSEIKQRFKSSKRLKTDDEIEFMQSL